MKTLMLLVVIALSGCSSVETRRVCTSTVLPHASGMITRCVTLKGGSYVRE